MVELVLEMLFGPIVGAFQAFVGIVWPSKDPEVLSLQRWTKAYFALALLAVLVAVVMHNRSAGSSTLLPIGVAYLLLVMAGNCGSQIEKRCRRQDKPKSPSEKIAE